MQVDQRIQRNIIGSLNKNFRDIRLRNSQLENKIKKHNIDNLATRRPNSVERIINNASKNATRCLELQSGAELTEKERNAKSAIQFNSECPWLWVNPSSN